MNKGLKNILSSELELPIDPIRVMQINAATNYPISLPNSVTNNGNSSSPVPQTGQDTVVIKFPANSYTSLVDEALQQPEIRPEVVAAYKLQIENTNYPPPEIIDGLIALVGNSLSQLSNSSGTSSPSPTQTGFNAAS